MQQAARVSRYTAFMLPGRDGGVRRDRTRSSLRRATNAPRTMSPAASATGRKAVVDHQHTKSEHTTKTSTCSSGANRRDGRHRREDGDRRSRRARHRRSRARPSGRRNRISRLDLLQREIEEQAVLMTIARLPARCDRLQREIIGAIRVAGDLERVGDLAKNIAAGARSRSASNQACPAPSSALEAHERVRDGAAQGRCSTLTCASATSSGRATSGSRDVELDALEDSVFRDLLTYMSGGSCAASPSRAHLLFSSCSKNIERIGDHATNIAETRSSTSCIPVRNPADRSPARAVGKDGHQRPKLEESSSMNQARKDIVRSPEPPPRPGHPDRRGRIRISPCCSVTISRRKDTAGRERRARRRSGIAAWPQNRARPCDPRLDAARRSRASKSAAA